MLFYVRMKTICPKRFFVQILLPKFVCEVKLFNLFRLQYCEYSRVYNFQQKVGTKELKLQIILPAQFEQSLSGVAVKYDVMHLNTHQDAHKMQGNTIHWTPSSKGQRRPNFLGAFAKLLKATISFFISVSPSVRPSVLARETTRIPLEGYSLNLMFEYFSKICLENSGLIKKQE